MNNEQDFKAFKQLAEETGKSTAELAKELGFRTSELMKAKKTPVTKPAT